jgi:hypothetical protein
LYACFGRIGSVWVVGLSAVLAGRNWLHFFGNRTRPLGQLAMLDKEADKRLDDLHKLSATLQRRAWRLNIEIPKEWWENDYDMQIESGARPDQLEFVGRVWLTDEGQERLKFLIQNAEEKIEDERLERRQKRLAFWQTIITLLFGLTGWLAGLYAMVFRR